MKKSVGLFKKHNPGAAKQVTSQRELKADPCACVTLFIDLIPVEALDLLCAQEPGFIAVNTSQSIHRMNPIYGDDHPLMCLTLDARFLFHAHKLTSFH